MEEIRVTFPDVPGAAIVGNEDAVVELIIQLASGSNMEQFAWLLLKADCSKNAGSLAGDPAREVDAIVDALQQRVKEWNGEPPKELYIDNGQ